MPLALLARIGHDTVGKLEAAAIRRFAEATRLAAHEPLGALYLYGYVVEIRLKTAYYRLAGIGEHDRLDVTPSGAAYSPRRFAEGQIRTLVGPTAGRNVGHDLNGWLQLLIATRAVHALDRGTPIYRSLWWIASRSRHGTGLNTFGTAETDRIIESCRPSRRPPAC